MSITKVESYLRDNYINEETIKLFITHEIDGIAFSQLKESDMIEMQIRIIGIRKKLLTLIKRWIYLETLKLETESSLMLFNCNKDFRKLAVSFLYIFIVFGITSFVMVIAHERLPDITKYPPLPDLILDNLPYISWAFYASEIITVLLLAFWASILVFHRYRFILLRRFFNLLGTVFLLRSITMVITSLSVPATHLHSSCRLVARNQSFSEKIDRALHIWVRLGLSINGVKTCGDYLFSGHSACLTMLNFFITEYTPRSSSRLHAVSWILTLLGLFCVLAAHEHYSIDVFVAFYLSSRLFLYYHWQASNYSLMVHDQQRAKIWFPMFSWFESNCPGTIPNQYELPFNPPFLKKEKKF